MTEAIPELAWIQEPVKILSFVQVAEIIVIFANHCELVIQLNFVSGLGVD